MTKIERIRKIVTEGQYARVEGRRVDLFTASVIVKVHDGLNAENRAKYEAMPVHQMAAVAWKLLAATKAAS